MCRRYRIHSRRSRTSSQKFTQLYQSSRRFCFPRKYCPLHTSNRRIPTSYRMAHQSRRCTSNQVYSLSRNQKCIDSFKQRLSKKKEKKLFNWINNCCISRALTGKKLVKLLNNFESLGMYSVTPFRLIIKCPFHDCCEEFLMVKKSPTFLECFMFTFLWSYCTSY